MGFPLTLRSMTLNCCKDKLSWNLETFLVLWRQQQLKEILKNEDRPVLSATDL